MNIKKKNKKVIGILILLYDIYIELIQNNDSEFVQVFY